MILRIVLGLILVIFGANKFGQFMPQPAFAGEAAEFMGALGKAGYFQILGILEIAIGLLLIVNKWVPFALVVLAPIVVNILIFHFNYDLAGIGAGALVSVLTTLLIYSNWHKYKSLF